MSLPTIVAGAGGGFLLGGPVGAVVGGVAGALMGGGAAAAQTPVVGTSADGQVAVTPDGGMLVAPTALPAAVVDHPQISSTLMARLLSDPGGPPGVTQASYAPRTNDWGPQPVFNLPTPIVGPYYKASAFIDGPGGPPNQQLAGFLPTTTRGWAGLAIAGVAFYYFRKDIERKVKWMLGKTRSASRRRKTIKARRR